MPRYLFPNGVATDDGACIVVQVCRDDGDSLPGNLLVDYGYQPNPPCVGIDWNAVSLAYGGQPRVVYVAGMDGEIIIMQGSEITREAIRPSTDGPDAMGPIREIRCLDSGVYVTGMGRQVYRREQQGVWSRIDSGLLDRTARPTAGLCSIASLGKNHLVTVGYEGAIWEYAGTWSEYDSPTNVLLTRVLAHDDRLFASGVGGTLLCRENDGWRVVDTSNFEDDVWDMESFGGRLYLASAKGVFVLGADESIRPVDACVALGQTRCSALSAHGGRLWSFGSGLVLTSVNGEEWRAERILDMAPA